MRITSDIFRLSDGRNLSFAEYGAKSGTPVLFCHGAPGSRWQVHPGMAHTAARMGMRVIVPERPGYGSSDIQPNRTLLDWTDDACELMNHLAIDRFHVLGYSMGSIHALACGHALCERVTGIGLVGSLAPNVFQPSVISEMASSAAQTWEAARADPEALQQLVRSLAAAPSQLLALFSGSLPLCDKKVIADPEVETGFQRDCEEALRNGGHGLVRDFVLGTQDWGFTLKTVHAPVTLWHGTEDVNTPVAMADYLMTRLPRCRLHLLPDEGHLCLFSRWEDILGAQTER